MLYWDKKISQELFSTPGLQLPDNLYNLDSNTIIRQISKKSTLSDKFSLKDSQVRFGLKHNKNGQTTLYVIVDQNTIELNNFEDIKKTKVIASKGLDKSNAPDARLVNINLPQLFNNVNAIGILRYIPDDFLTISQRELKYQGIADTIKYNNDKNDEKYREYISKHDYALGK